MQQLSRRCILAGAAALPFTRAAVAQAMPIKIGLMLPFSGADAAIGETIAAAFGLCLQERDNRLGGRATAIVRRDDASDPAKAVENVKRLLDDDHADVLVGSVHPGVTMTMVQAARERMVPLIIPHDGSDAAARALCAPSIFRSSFSNWQPAYGIGKALAATGVKKVACITWDWATGKEAGEGFSDGLRAGGGQLTHMLLVEYADTHFLPVLSVLSGIGVDAVGAFFAGDSAAQFVKDYATAGLHGNTPLCGWGFLTEGASGMPGAAADGIQTALHYGDGLDNARNTAFRAAFRQMAGRDANVYAVQGYDAAQLLAIGLDATSGDATAIKPMAAAIEAAKIDSPRGAFTLSPSHNPVQAIYLREVKGGENRVVGVAADALADPGTGCQMGT
jgi:branched-chain amino acid transport system substrate-binding protein